MRGALKTEDRLFEVSNHEQSAWHSAPFSAGGDKELFAQPLDNTIQAITLSSPVVFAPGSTVVAELHVADGVAASNIFFPGSNTAGETAASYVRAAGAAACNINEPVTYASLGFPQVHMLIKLRGTTP